MITFFFNVIIIALIPPSPSPCFSRLYMSVRCRCVPSGTRRLTNCFKNVVTPLLSFLIFSKRTRFLYLIPPDVSFTYTRTIGNVFYPDRVHVYTHKDTFRKPPLLLLGFRLMSTIGGLCSSLIIIIIFQTTTTHRSITPRPRLLWVFLNTWFILYKCTREIVRRSSSSHTAPPPSAAAAVAVPPLFFPTSPPPVDAASFYILYTYIT